MPNYTPSQVYDKYVSLQKQLATNITNKGVTASETELYDNLIDKVAQIENLKGEERTLENFTNVLDEPKSIVQLEYPNPAPKTLNAKLGSKNLFDKSLSIKDVYVTADALRKGYKISVDAGTYTVSGGSSTTFCKTLIGDTYGTYHSLENPVTLSLETDGYILAYSDNISSVTAILDTLQIEHGSAATTYTPYISDFSTVNVTRRGKNLIPYPYVSPNGTVINGITWTYTSDGALIANGTAAENSNFGIVGVNNAISVAGQKVILSGCPDNGGVNKYGIYYYDTVTSQYDYGGGVAFIPTGVVTINARIYKGETVTNLVFKPQLELGTTATEFEPYQGQIYTPTATGEVTGITNLYPLTTLLTDNAGVLFTEVTGGVYKEILPSEGKNGITKVLQPATDSTIDSNITPDNIKQGVSILGITGDYICNYTYDETTKELVLIL